MKSDNTQGRDDVMSFHSGFVALVGRPSVGKSTLLNAMLGEKIAPVSPVAQTTRRRLRAVINTDTSQLVIVDTPGLHKPKDALGRELNRTALASMGDVDVVAFLIDATAPVGTGDAWVARHVAAAGALARVLVITKADAATPEQVSSQLDAARELASFDDELVLSAKVNFNVDSFISLVTSFLPEGPRWFDENMTSDATDEELVAEFVREKVLLNCRQEVPHSVAVRCDEIRWTKDDHASMHCVILVERESQKGIIIGQGGRMIKLIGTQARRDIERLFSGARVYLDLEVRVQPSWRRDRNEIARLGYRSED